MKARLQFASLGMALAVFLCTETNALAKPCGDDVNDVDVPCACGDMVVSDVILGNDPITRDTCAGDGLIVRSLQEAPLTVDLAGRRLRGDGSGNGIWLIYGGKGGARVISSGPPAVLEGFATGVVSAGDDALASVENIRVERPQRDGMRLRGAGYSVSDCQVEAAGRDGFSLSGRGFRVAAARSAGSRRYGFMVMGQGAEIGAPGTEIAAANNGSAGFNLMGANHVLRACVATDNGKDGVSLSGAGMRIEGCLARANGGDGISGMGSDWWIGGSRAVANGGSGIAVNGSVVDGGGNSGVDNGFLARGAVVQCAVSGAPCLP